MNLYLLDYSNYYNRIVKREDDLLDYLKYQIGPTLKGINFIPNDYIDTTQVINWKSEYKDPDYLLVVDESTNRIVTRWYVVSTTRLREGQLQLELHRDLVADYYEETISAPCFIEKATITDINDPAIYNKEDMSFNQIKQGEYPLKDKSGTAWIVGYVPRDITQSSPKNVSINYTYQGTQDLIVNQLSDYQYFNYSTGDEFKGPVTDYVYSIRTYSKYDSTLPSGGISRHWYDFSINLSQSGSYAGIDEVVMKGGDDYTGIRSFRHIDDLKSESTTSLINPYITDGPQIFSKFNSVIDSMNSVVPSYLQTSSQSDYDIFKSQNNKVIYNREDGQYYKVKIVESGSAVPISQSLAVNSYLYNVINNNIDKTKFSGIPNASTYVVSGVYKTYRIVLELLTSKVDVDIPADNQRYHLNDSPYDMFFIPCPEVGQSLTIYKNGNVFVDKVDRAAGISIASQIAAELGSKNIYDVQLLPYCPMQSIIKEDGTIDIGDTLNTPINTLVNNDKTPKAISVLFWALNSEFTVDIPFVIEEGATPIDKKIKNETEFWRLCSPNYSGVFEFNPQKNNGVSHINIDCNYKPYSPYIHASIDFKNLYGADYNDSRGLICGGDFSLPQITDAWSDYALSNKNYGQIFNREIQNMEVNNNIQREREAWSIAAGTLTGGASGAGIGSFISGGNPISAGIGAGVGAGLSLAGGLLDRQLNEKLRNEALDYKHDMFGYQLQNIQALPQGLSKVSAFTANNKIFPFLEKYSCTDKEKGALQDKIKYNGMTIMRIGTIDEFNSDTISYIKGRLIRMETLDEDYHIVNAIADEIYKGVFIKDYGYTE